MECLTKLVGLKDLCGADSTDVKFWLDDAEGIDRQALADLCKPSNGSGKEWGNAIIDAASRFLIADIETLVPKGYTIKTSLNSFCNTCTYTSITTAQPFTGVIVKNISTSRNAYLSIDSLKVMIQSSGNNTIVLDDGIEPKMIAYNFTAGVEAIFTNINFKTSATSVRIYFSDPVDVVALNCPTTKSCGCSGQQVNSKDLQVKGLLNNAEFTTQYGFIPCASVVCSLDNVLCSLINQQPRLYALALWYRSVSAIYSETIATQRNNVMASFNKDEKKALADRYLALYYERLNGSDTVKGVADNLAAAMNSINDPCIECKRLTGVAWATG